MKNDSKKLAMYIGIALLVGSAGYLAYAKMTDKKNVLVDTNEVDDVLPTSNWSSPKPFSSNPLNQLEVGQIGIKTPSIAEDLLNSFK
jgi:hypothetical protein